METNEVSTKKTLLQKLKLFVVKPSELFKDYLEKPAWALKLLVIAVVTALYTYATKILGKDLFTELMEEKAASMPPDQAEAVKGSITFLNSPMMNGISALIGAVSIIAIILLISLVYMAFVRALKGKIKYSQMVSVYTLAYMASVIGILVKLAYMYLTGNLLYINLSPTFVDALYDNLDLFIIWQSILMVFGISAVSGLPEKKSTIIVVGMWLISLAISFGSIILAK
ncbi:MAG TPA: YIP1 family protein [Clostridia bacterium]|nr:YIP1 family protein [Clostridia bacterium]